MTRVGIAEDRIPSVWMAISHLLFDAAVLLFVMFFVITRLILGANHIPSAS